MTVLPFFLASFHCVLFSLLISKKLWNCHWLIFKHHYAIFYLTRIFKKKDPKGCTLHLKVPTRGHDILPVREWMTEKEREKRTRAHSRDMADSFHKNSIGGGMGDCWRFFFFFFFIAPTIVSNCHHILSASGNTATKETEENKQSSIVRLSQWPWKIFPPIIRWPGPQALCHPHPHRLLCLQNDQKASMVTGLSLYSSSDLLGGIHLF